MIYAIGFLAVAVFLLITGFSRLLVRDKRYTKGVKKRFNYVSLIFFVLSLVALFLSYRFYYADNL